MNIELLRRVQKEILKRPTQVDMTTWFARNPFAEGCGTTACIAGWTIAIHQKWPMFRANPRRVGRKFYDREELIPQKAAELLGLSTEEAQRLFHVVSWPEPYRLHLRLYREATHYIPDATYSLIVSDRIDHFIKTGGEE